MFGKLIHKVRYFGYMMKNPIPRKIFFLRHFAPKRYAELKVLMNTLDVDFYLEIIDEDQFNDAILAF